MDLAYNQHSNRSKRHSRSAINLNHLTVAPLTPKLPLNDVEAVAESHPYVQSPREYHISYIEGRSAPTTPGILSRSSSRLSLRRSAPDGLSKSKSSTFITNRIAHPSRPGVISPGSRGPAVGKGDLKISTLSPLDHNNSDWLLRAGALISSETRESKGQAWLVSRSSSISLSGERNVDEEILERALARERDSRQTSRRASAAGGYGDADDEYSPVAARMSSGSESRPISRHSSRTTTCRGSKAHPMVPMPEFDKEKEDYFHAKKLASQPDFVDIDEDIYDPIQSAEDDFVVRRLAKRGTLNLGTWLETLMEWRLFSAEEDEEEETDIETSEHNRDASDNISHSHPRDNISPIFMNIANTIALPAPHLDEGGWQDAAWLLSVATKVLL